MSELSKEQLQSGANLGYALIIKHENERPGEPIPEQLIMGLGKTALELMRFDSEGEGNLPC